MLKEFESYDEILDLPIDIWCADVQYETVRQFLAGLLLTLWTEQEGFSGKRPFGNSDWEYELYKPLIQAGFVEGKLDEDDFIEDCNEKAAWTIIRAAIKHMCKG